MWVGVLLLAVCWPLDWLLPGEHRTACLFFPLWLGYILVVDAWVGKRRGDSIWTRSPAGFAWLFVLSAPVWWLFELLNWRTGNWEYLGAQLFTPAEYYLLCTLCFSVVMPAVFETAELVRSFPWLERFASGPRIAPTPRLCSGLLATGLAMLGLLLLWPRIFYPFTWAWLVLVLEPFNRRAGRRISWRTFSVATGAECSRSPWARSSAACSGKCGIIIPSPNGSITRRDRLLRVFEMPLLGYGGYVPFGLELYALRNFLWPNGSGLRV